MKQEYIEQIMKLLPECERIEILNLIFQLLSKTRTQ